MLKQGLIITVFLFAAGLYIALSAPSVFLNPGRVSAGHVKIEGDCFRCHDAFTGPNDDKCKTCHKLADIDTKTTNRVSFHSSLLDTTCTKCHTEHAAVGVFRKPRAFDHSMLAARIQKSCHRCHSAPRDALHVQLSGECGACHTQQSWKPTTFDHSRYFRFDRHHLPDCGSCHPGQKYDHYTCYSCHEHSASKIRNEHLEEGIRDFRNCTACHRSGDEHESERIWYDLRRRGISPSGIGKISEPPLTGVGMSPSWYRVDDDEEGVHHDGDDD